MKHTKYEPIYSLLIIINFSLSFPEDKSLYFPSDEDFLLIFLRPCKFYAKSAYELMKRSAQYKEKHAALLGNLMPIDEKVALVDHNVVNVLKGRDHKGRRILVVNCGKTWDPSAVTADQILRLFYLIHQLAMREPLTQVSTKISDGTDGTGFVTPSVL